jgi:hypothetical protein
MALSPLAQSLIVANFFRFSKVELEPGRIIAVSSPMTDP